MMYEVFVHIAYISIIAYLIYNQRKQNERLKYHDDMITHGMGFVVRQDDINKQCVKYLMQVENFMKSVAKNN